MSVASISVLSFWLHRMHQSDVRVVVIDDLVSKNYVDMTIDVMNKFAVDVERDSYREFCVKSGQNYKGCEYVVEPDASGASYFFACCCYSRWQG